MVRNTLIDFFDDFAGAAGEFLVFDDGYRSYRYTYADVARAARNFAAQLAARGVTKGDRVILWGENRPEWIVALWGCLLRGVVAVPIDYRATAEFLQRVQAIVGARVLLLGHEVEVPGLSDDLRVWPMAELLGRDEQHAWPAPPPVEVSRDDVVEIIFTSGATAEPKGVVITHRNVLANIVPIEREVLKYRKYGRPFFPLRFLNLLPLSHMFGQAMATFIPPMLPGVVVFMRGYNPAEIARQIRTRRVSVLVCVPKILDVLREHLTRQFPETAHEPAGRAHWIRRWWRHRSVHRYLGWKFWSVVVGAAPLDPALEEFMGRLGFLVVQGYGLTETAPIVTLNHPFSARKGSVGKPIAGVEVKIAGDGEILVRGENVTRGYYRADRDADGAFEDGWLHTGDVGGVDEDGRLHIRGRKKEMIVTPEGLNVFPEDVERALNGVSGVRDSAVVGRVWAGEERVHAVIVVDPGTDPQEVLKRANATLLDHQKVRSVSTWPGSALPRTEGTGKLRRREIKAWVEEGGEPAGDRGRPRDALTAVVERWAHRETPVTRETTLDELGLTSLERVELLMALEERFEVTVDETAFAAARTVEDLHALVGSPASSQGRVPTAASAGRSEDHEVVTPAATSGARRAEPVDFPAWNRSWLARLVRRASLATWILPLTRAFVWLRADGLQHLRTLDGPVVFAANHQSHLDTPAILAALPGRWRYRLAVAMAKEFFQAHFFPERFGRRARLTNTLNYYLASLFFNAFPLPQREAGTRQTLRYIGSLLSAGESVLIFPEGRRTIDGEINTFRAGVGMIGARLGVPVVPVRLEGLDRVLHQTWRMARPGRARVTFGPPLRLSGDNYAELADRVERAVRTLSVEEPAAGPRG
jgi:long-chain acyl-CoA synthetase